MENKSSLHTLSTVVAAVRPLRTNTGLRAGIAVFDRALARLHETDRLTGLEAGAITAAARGGTTGFADWARALRRAH